MKNIMAFVGEISLLPFVRNLEDLLKRWSDDVQPNFHWSQCLSWLSLYQRHSYSSTSNSFDACKQGYDWRSTRSLSINNARRHTRLSGVCWDTGRRITHTYRGVRKLAMKILVDENIPSMTVDALLTLGNDVLDVRGTPNEGMTDPELWPKCQGESR